MDHQLPGPIARPLRRYLDASDPTERAAALLDVVEALVHHLAVVGLSAFDASGDDDPVLVRRILEVLLRPSWSLGTLLFLVDQLARRLHTDRHPYPELAPALLRDDGRVQPAHRLLTHWVELRNREFAHAAGRDPARYERLLDAEAEPVLDLLGAWTFLGDRALGCWSEEEGWRRLMGTAASGWTGDAPPKIPLFIEAPGGGFLPLQPFSWVQRELTERGVFLLQRVRWEGGRVRSLRYVAYDSALGELRLDGQSVAGVELNRLSERLGGPGAEASEPGMQRIAGVEAERAAHSAGFVGRQEDRERLDARLAGGGFVLLVGEPGAGKSALACQVASDSDCALLHLVSAQPDPFRWIPAVAAQTAEIAGSGVDRGVGAEDLDELREVLLSCLQTVRDTEGRCTLVLDGLDELPPHLWGLPFLPRFLPDGVSVLLTARAVPALVQGLRRRFPALVELELGGLPVDDALQLALRAGLEPAEARRVARVSGGNPLLLRHLARRVLGGADVGAVQGELGELLWGEALSAAPHAATERVLLLLALAREPLDLDDLEDLLAHGGAEVPRRALRAVLADLGPFLRQGQGRWRLFHRTLQDHALREVLGPRGRARQEGVFVRWLGDAPLGMGPYGRRHWPSHGAATGDFEGLRRRVSAVTSADPEHLRAVGDALRLLDEAGEPLPPLAPAAALEWAHTLEAAGRWAEAASALTRLEGVPGRTVRLAQLASSRGRVVEAERRARQALEEPGTVIERARAFNTWGRALMDLADAGAGWARNREAAERAFQQVLELAAGDRARSRALNNLGVLARLDGRRAEAWEHQQEARRLRERLGLDRHRAWSLHDIGWLHADAGRLEDARDSFEQAAELARRGADPHATLWALRSLATLDPTADRAGWRRLNAQVGLRSFFYEVAGYGSRLSGRVEPKRLGDAAEAWWATEAEAAGDGTEEALTAWVSRLRAAAWLLGDQARFEALRAAPPMPTERWGAEVAEQVRSLEDGAGRPTA